MSPRKRVCNDYGFEIGTYCRSCYFEAMLKYLEAYKRNFQYNLIVFPLEAIKKAWLFRIDKFFFFALEKELYLIIRITKTNVVLFGNVGKLTKVFKPKPPASQYKKRWIRIINNSGANIMEKSCGGVMKENVRVMNISPSTEKQGKLVDRMNRKKKIADFEDKSTEPETEVPEIPEIEHPPPPTKIKNLTFFLKENLDIVDDIVLPPEKEYTGDENEKNMASVSIEPSDEEEKEKKE